MFEVTFTTGETRTVISDEHEVGIISGEDGMFHMFLTGDSLDEYYPAGEVSSVARL